MELMIVVTVLGVLAGLAIAAYQDYLARTQMAEAMKLASGTKPNIAEFANNVGHFPLNNSSAGLSRPQSITGTYVSAVTVYRGVVTAELRNSRVASGIKGAELILSPYRKGENSSYLWTCRSTAAPEYLPAICRE